MNDRDLWANGIIFLSLTSDHGDEEEEHKQLGV